MHALAVQGALDLYGHETERDPHEAIVRLEQHIEELDAKIESCRKFILASQIAVAAGGIVLAAMLVGAIRFDPGTMAAVVAAVLGGIVVWGSNRSTSKEAAKELTAAEADRAALIDMINPRVIP
jgi:ABC-type transport system involved in cytochrome bd biosynthesis fused ATPase/permease subunit